MNKSEKISYKISQSTSLGNFRNKTLGLIDSMENMPRHRKDKWIAHMKRAVKQIKPYTDEIKIIFDKKK